MVLDVSIAKNITTLKTILNTEHNFDIVFRDFQIAGRRACLFFIDGYVKDESITKLYQGFLRIGQTGLTSMKQFCEICVPFCDVSVGTDVDRAVTSVLSGRVILLIDGLDQAAEVDMRSYPQRTTGEPDKEKVMRGSKDGFVETLVLNCALIRRRVRSPDLCIEYMQMGKTSKTDIGICYMNGRVDKKLLRRIKNRMQTAKNTDALTMNQQSLADLLVGRSWINPFPKFRYTERVDTACAQILEGDIIILIDNAPSAMMLPVSFFDGMEEANDFYFPPITGSYMKLVRYVMVILIAFGTPLWLLFLQNPQIVPESLKFILIDTSANVPIVVQLLIIEVLVDGLKLASLNTPTMMTTTMGLIGGIVVGDFAVGTGWVCGEVLLYSAVIATATFSLPSYEISYAVKFLRMVMLITTALFNVWGFVGGVVFSILCLALNKTTAGFTYLFPLVPFNGRKLLEKFFRIKQGNR